MTIRTLFFATLSMLLPICGNAALAQSDIDQATRDRVVDSIASQIETNFYDSRQAARIASELRSELETGDFDSAQTAEVLAAALSSRLNPIDRHFGVRYSPPSQGEADDVPAPSPRRNPFANGELSNFGFNTVDILPGNIGYIEMNLFFPASLGGETAISALDFVQHTEALIFDVRQSGGGAPSMVQLLISHLFDAEQNITLNTFLNSSRDYPFELNSLAYLPSEPRPDIPVYVLTSRRTASAAEAFPYHLQALERAKVVGDRTSGAGNPGSNFDAGDGFTIFISTARTVSPITEANWEGTGVIPDIEAAQEDALDVALADAYATLSESAEDETRQQTYAWLSETMDIGTPDFASDSYADLAGQYGPFALRVIDQGLELQMGARPVQRLYPAGEDRFIVENAPTQRLLIRRDRRGDPTAIVWRGPDGIENFVARR